ncbi:MAG: Peptidase family M50 [Lentisphaerae bacterium ADurb.BinA184]|nr:MAG: Peptidase family M50 [Lentisphaerae bacterium ADurb.BinA184]
MFIELLWKQPDVYVAMVVLLVFSICVHEYCHAWMAWREGDPTAVQQGYLTLNPLRVMGPVSLVFLALVGVAWGAVPVNPMRLRGRGSHGRVSLAGPAANLVLAAAFAGLVWVAGGRMAPLAFIAGIGLNVNVLLFLFNLLPLPPLDGWEVFSWLIPALRRVSHQKAQQFGFIVLLVLMMSGLFRYLWAAADFVTGLVLSRVA